MDVRDVEGGCCCGSVRYRAESHPLGSMICHCQTCRRIAGSPVVAWVTFQKDRFRFTRGVPTEFRSSEDVRRTFCSKCGTPLTYEGSRFPSEIDVTTCSLDDPNATPPTHHSWVSHDLSWIRFGDGLPSFPTTRQDGAQGADMNGSMATFGAGGAETKS